MLMKEASHSKTASSLHQRDPVVSAKPSKEEKSLEEKKTNATSMHDVQKEFLLERQPTCSCYHGGNKDSV